MLIGINSNRAHLAKELYKSGYEPSTSFIIDQVLDICILGVFLWFGHYVLSIFYAISVVAGKEIRTVGKEYTFESLVKEKRNES